jgi:hypothetical protein
MNLQRMSDADLRAELERQQEIQKRNPPDSSKWIAASRIIHHCAAEVRRRSAITKADEQQRAEEQRE